MIDLAAKPFSLKPEDIEWVNTTMAGMTTEEKAGQLFCVLFKECKPEEFEYVFNILKPGGCMYRVVPTERAIAATQNIYSRSKVPPLIAANLEKGGNGIVTEGTLVGAPMEIAATDDIGMATKMAHACAAEASAASMASKITVLDTPFSFETASATYRISLFMVTTASKGLQIRFKVRFVDIGKRQT